MDLNGSRKQNNLSMPNQDWADWLSNDGPSPAIKEEIRRQRVKQAGIYTPRGFNSQPMMAAGSAASDEVKSVVINLHLPKLNSLMPNGADIQKFKKIKLSRRRLGIAAAVLVVLFLIKLNPSPAPQTQTNSASPPVVQAAHTSAQASQISPVTTTNLATASSSPVAQPQNTVSASALSNASDRSSPSFTPVVPASEPQLKNPTFGRTSYSSATNVYTIVDSFGAGPVTINETSAPAGSSADSIAKANADKISQSQVISLPSGDAYLTAPTRSGQQTAVLAVGNVIIFVNSKVAHTVSDWQTYLTNLN